MRFRGAVRALALVGSVSALAVMGRAASGGSASVAVSWSAGQVGKSMQEAFVEPYPEKDALKVTEAVDNTRFTQMLANRATPNTDLATFVDVIMPLVIKSSLLAKLDIASVPNLGEVDPALRGWDDYAVPYCYGTWGIVYNADKVKQPIVSWADLLRSDLKGHVTSPNITYNSSIYTLDAMARLKGGSLQDPMTGFDAMRQIRLSGPGLWDQESIAIGWLKTEEVWASAFYSGSALRLKGERDTSNLRFVIPREGGYLVPSNFVRLARSPDAAGADKFLNYILSRDAQSRWAEIGKSRAANRFAAVPADVAASVPPSSDLIKIDAAYFAANRTSIVQKWNEVVNR